MVPKPDLMFKAFSDETRLRILHLLARGELCVCDLLSVLRLPQSTVSRHLAYLRRSGLVADRKDGLWRHYALVEARGRLHRGLLSCLRDCFDGVPELRKDRIRLDRIRKKKYCGGE